MYITDFAPHAEQCSTLLHLTRGYLAEPSGVRPRVWEETTSIEGYYNVHVVGTNSAKRAEARSYLLTSPELGVLYLSTESDIIRLAYSPTQFGDWAVTVILTSTSATYQGNISHEGGFRVMVSYSDPTLSQGTVQLSSERLGILYEYPFNLQQGSLQSYLTNQLNFPTSDALESYYRFLPKAISLLNVGDLITEVLGA